MISNIENNFKHCGYALVTDKNINKGSGKLYHVHNENISGLCLLYDFDDFWVVFRDHIINKELISKGSDIDYKINDLSFSSGYFDIASGEWFKPYRSIVSNSLYVMTKNDLHNMYLLHKDTKFTALNFYFSNSFINKYLTVTKQTINFDLYNPDFLISDSNAKSCEKFLDIYTVLNSSKFSLNKEDLKIFAYKWLDALVEKYTTLSNKKDIDANSIDALLNVTEYINDHFSSDISHSTLEKISMLNSNKLKNLFKAKYGMNISEYIQKRRIYMAEVLLLTTDLDIKDIATSVGYASHSRFSTLYKKYKGVYPKDVRKMKLRDDFSSFSDININLI